MSSTASGRAQRAAWDTYLAVTAALLPTLAALEPGDDAACSTGVIKQLYGVAMRIRRYAPMWGEPGETLSAAAQSAVDLYREGDRPALVALLQAMARRLFLISAGRASQPHGGDNPPAP